MGSGVISFAIFGRDNSRLFSSLSDAEVQSNPDLEMFIFCSLDIFDEKASKAQEMYLGQLYSDQKYKSFGLLTNSGIRMLLVLDLKCSSLQDQELRALFKRLHIQYCNAITNPFYSIGAPLNSRIVFKMEDGFSGVVRLSNISDFIAPNLDCVIPLETKTVHKKPENSLVKIHAKDKPETCEKIESQPAVKISLNDCLACNGCITSAETVLIEEQSIERFWSTVGSKSLSVVSVSPQSVASIAASRQIHISTAARLISAYFRSLGVSYVVDSSIGRQFALSLAYSECSTSPSAASAPILSSACPGFVCFAEKSQGQLLVPLISKIRSPQAINGALVKDYLRRKFNLQPEEVYHATVMPCYDKKLEASRPDFLVPGSSTVRETDLVISTAELASVLKDQELPTNEDLSEDWLHDFSRGKLIGEPGGSSGGYAERVAREHAAKTGRSITRKRM
ncbi:hypothetical protein WR25_03646 isoform D [Diploscapter pachys]|uniref:Trafficking protein particle complex subunit 2-like protein n=1 Tax=Diploscapter pachys TaxID=2018661 RepID=A0A2A2KMU2_9BILA|nr:hypothetical protein WR25_03646 isoform B [Diploscapter pachys]PAV75286.1 hypothetical protein WR25_03646 isoform D [Diploscapter pachys]